MQIDIQSQIRRAALGTRLAIIFGAATVAIFLMSAVAHVAGIASFPTETVGLLWLGSVIVGCGIFVIGMIIALHEG